MKNLVCAQSICARSCTLTKSRIDPARALSWKSGMITFTDVTLAEAAAEMNRYSGIKVRVDEDVAGERLSGVFRAGDQEGFAATLKGFLAVETEPSGQEILIRLAIPSPK